MSTVREIIEAKGNTIWSVQPGHTVKDTLRFMAEKNIGAVIILEGDKIAGIFSERDFARHSAKQTVRPEDVLVKDMMTSHISVIAPSITTDECMAIMTTKRIRHLPVMDNNKLIGLISIGDVVNRIILDHKFAITQLENYVSGS